MENLTDSPHKIEDKERRGGGAGVEQRFPMDGGGSLTVREEGVRAVAAAERPDDGRGLYKAYLNGPGGRVLLGTMAPEGGLLRVRRTLSLDELRRRGAWPPRGGGAELSFSFSAPDTPTGWLWADPAGLPFREAELLRTAVRLGRVLCRRGAEGFALAYPFSAGEPFPFAELFCFAAPLTLGGRRHVQFLFTPEGVPRMPE